MKYYVTPPPLELAPYVRFFWGFEGAGISTGHDPYVYRSMADGCLEMVFHYKGLWEELTPRGKENSFVSGMHGQSQHFRRFITEEDFGIFGVYFYPFAATILFELPANWLSNEMADMKTCFGAQGAALEEQIVLASSYDERIAITTQFLQKRLTRSDKADKGICLTIRKIIESKGQTDIEALAKNQFLSLRQFQRNFRLYAGFSPKLYCRIIRFHAAMNHYRKAYRSLTDIAYDCGYYDQSHFIREFKEFSGYHPKQFFWGRSEGIEWRQT